MKVAIGVDGSKLSNQAVAFASRLLSARVDDLYLYYSTPTLQLTSSTPVADTALARATEALNQEVFREARKHLSPELDQVVQSFHDQRLPADGLVELADTEDVDLIVVGSMSQKRRFPFVLGSTARHVVHNTKRPVMVVRGKPKPATEPLRVLVACDKDRWCDANETFRNFSWPDDAKTTLFHVTQAYDDEFVESLTRRSNMRPANLRDLVREYQTAIAEQKEAAAEHLRETQRSGPQVIASATVEVASGDVVDELVAKVERDKIDLVIVSSRHLRLMGRLLGSVTESLLTRCPCSLLIVPTKRQAAKSRSKRPDATVAIPE